MKNGFAAMYFVEKRLIEINTNWVRIIGEQVRDEKGRILDYWRVEKDNSLIPTATFSN